MKSSSLSRRQRLISMGSRGLTVSTTNSAKKKRQQEETSPQSQGSGGSGSSNTSLGEKLAAHFRRGKKNKKSSASPMRSSTELTSTTTLTPAKARTSTGSRSSVPDVPMSPPAEGRLKLVPKIAQYRAKEYITAKQEASLLALLEEQHYEDDTALYDQASLQVERALHEAKEQYFQSGRANKAATVMTPTSTPKQQTPKSLLLRKSPRRVSFAAKDTHKMVHSPDLTPRALTSVRDGTKKAIIEIEDVWENSEQSEESLQTLFVEMCFFARLGFVQPPQCLQCLYRESMERKESNPLCERLVVWRKNARTLLHPNRLDENLVLVQCHAAQALIHGKTVQSRNWDATRRQLVYHM